MPRHTAARLLALPLLAVLAMAVWSPHAASAENWPCGTLCSSGDFKMDIQLSSDRLMRVQCDGDSVPILVRITRVSDGSPVAGATVRTDAGEATTNRSGVARGAIIPDVRAPGSYPWRAFAIAATVEGVSLSYGPRAYSCPFPEGEFGLTAHVFVDRNGNAALDNREPNFSRRDVTLSLTSGQTWVSYLPGRRYVLDGTGTFATTVDRSGVGTGTGWGICLADSEVARGWLVVSLNGAALPAPANCVGQLQLAPGDNRITIGVARTERRPPK